MRLGVSLHLLKEYFNELNSQARTKLIFLYFNTVRDFCYYFNIVEPALCIPGGKHSHELVKVTSIIHQNIVFIILTSNFGGQWGVVPSLTKRENW